MNYGFVITAAGLNLIASLLAEETLEITSVWVGNGRTDDTSDPVQFTDLISPIALATSTTPVVNNRQAEFVVQYRNDLNGGLPTGFFLNEFGVKARKKGDTAEGKLIYYGSLGDYPQWVQPASVGALDVRSYPVSIGLNSDANVSLNYPAVAFLTAEDLQVHNQDPTAHENRFSEMQNQLDGIHNTVEVSNKCIPDFGVRTHYRNIRSIPNYTPFTPTPKEETEDEPV